MIDAVNAATTGLTTKVPTTRLVSAGAGLSGGGDLSADRTLAVVYGTAASTAAQGNDSRIVNAVPNTRQVIAGTGLTGGGALSADQTLTVAYGTSGTTAAVGNDSRFTTMAGQLTTLTSYGRWYSTDVSTHTSAAEAMHPFTAVQALTGITVGSDGGFTFSNAGVYEITGGWHATYNLALNTGFNTNVFISDGTAAGASITTIYAQAQGYQVMYSTAAALEFSGSLHTGPVALAAGALLYFHVGAAQNVLMTGGDGYRRNFVAIRRLS
jgi:hypothetical protein